MLPTIAHSPYPLSIFAYLDLLPQLFFLKKLPFTIGKSNHLKSGTDITVLGYGPILTQLFSDDFKKYSLDIINCSSIKPLDSELILKSIKKN